MRILKSFLSLALGIAALAAGPALASQSHFKLIHADDLAQMMSSPAKGHLYVFDANTRKVREQYGVIPGARLLASSAGYDATQTLPKDKQAELVFYCANTMCTASHSAAERAVSVGFGHVFVMSDGIMGWKKSGHPTAPVTE